MIYEHADGGHYMLVEHGDMKLESGAWVPGVAYRCLKDGRLRMTTTDRFVERFKLVEAEVVELPARGERGNVTSDALRSAVHQYHERVEQAAELARSMNMDLAVSDFSVGGGNLTWSMFPIPYNECPPADGRRWRIIHCAKDD